MTDHPCEVCARPQGDDATFCIGCAHLLDAALADVAAYHGLAYDLDLATSKQTIMTARDGGYSFDVPLPYHRAASDAAAVLKHALAGWARIVIVETGVGSVPTLGPVCRSCVHRSCRDIRTRGLPADATASLAAFLRPRVGWLRHHPAGAQAHDAITSAVADARRVCDRPADRIYAGPCDCGIDLYARLDAAYVICRAPDHDEPLAWPVEQRRRWLLDSARDVLASGTEISRALTRYAQPVTPSALRGYVHRGTLASKGERREGGRMVALYRLGDVLDILARQAERVA